MGSHAIVGGQHTVQYRLKPVRYRYRNDRSTAHNRRAFDKILARIGRVKYVKGYRYFGRYNTTHEAVLVVGEKGKARFGGLLWGYSGEGPRGLHELLTKLGVSASKASEIAFQTPRLNQIGEDWRLTATWEFTPGRIES